MAYSLNKAQVLGNIGNDPEVRYAPSGDCICNFTLATTDKWKDKQTGEVKEKTEWHRIAFFGKAAEVLRDHAKKGTKLMVEGSLQTRKWQDNNGNDRYTTEIKGKDFIFCDSRGGNQGQSQAPAQPAQQQPQAPQQQTQDFTDFEDDIPF